MTLQSIMIDGNCVWFADDKPGLGWWHSGAIQPQTDASDQPKASVIEAGGVLMVQCVARLAPKPESNVTLATEFARQMGQSPDQVVLNEANLTVREARLELRTGDGQIEVLGRSQSSGMYPFVAAISATVMDKQVDVFRAALAGEDGAELIAVYDLTVDLPFAVAAIEHHSMETPDTGGAPQIASASASFGSTTETAANAAGSVASSFAGDAMDAMAGTPTPGTASASAAYLETGTNAHPIQITTNAARWFPAP